MSRHDNQVDLTSRGDLGKITADPFDVVGLSALVSALHVWRLSVLEVDPGIGMTMVLVPLWLWAVARRRVGRCGLPGARGLGRVPPRGEQGGDPPVVGVLRGGRPRRQRGADHRRVGVRKCARRLRSASDGRGRTWLAAACAWPRPPETSRVSSGALNRSRAGWACSRSPESRDAVVTGRREHSPVRRVGADAVGDIQTGRDAGDVEQFRPVVTHHQDHLLLHDFHASLDPAGLTEAAIVRRSSRVRHVAPGPTGTRTRRLGGRAPRAVPATNTAGHEWVPCSS
ncbi:MAG: hypothetical protein QOE61_1918 [Micromonosporaceae bacterium]|nr:hypothetical protein [Micromonosporaceae bacterium]